MIPSPLSVRRIGSTPVEVTTLGFGAAAVGNLYRAISDAEARETVAAALSGSIGYIDTAPHYGQGLSERRLGAVLPPRITLSTKVGRVLNPIPAPPAGQERHGFVDGDAFEPEFDYSYDGVMRSFADSCRRLRRERVDILLAHDLGVMTHGADNSHHVKAFLDGGYRAMAELKASGRVGAIGLGVNEWQVCEDVLAHADLDVVLLAGRYTLLEQGALDHFLPLCTRRGVSIVLGGPYNSGALVDGGHYNYGAVPAEVAARIEALKAVCRAFDVPLAAAALQFPLAHPRVASVIPGQASPREVEANLKLFSTPVPAAMWSELKSKKLLHPDAPVPAEKVAVA